MFVGGGCSQRGHDCKPTFSVSGPVLECITCLRRSDGEESSAVMSSTANHQQFLVTFDGVDGEQVAKFKVPTATPWACDWTVRGAYPGLCAAIDGTLLPEPDALARALLALGGAFSARRPRSSPLAEA